MIVAANRLHRHGDYQRVYRSSRKRFGKQMSYFFLLRDPRSTDSQNPESALRSHAETPGGPRIGLTVGRAMGNAVDRNRIKRRMRAAVQSQLAALSGPVDVVLHPNRRVAELDFVLLIEDVHQIFEAIQHAIDRQLLPRVASSVSAERS
jgi:ribonuclease P protein component